MKNPKLNSLSKFSTDVTLLDFIELFLLFLEKKHTKGQAECQSSLKDKEISYSSVRRNVEVTYVYTKQKFSIFIL